MNVCIAPQMTRCRWATGLVVSLAIGAWASVAPGQSPSSGLTVSLVPINSGVFQNGVFNFPTDAGSPEATVFELAMTISGTPSSAFNTNSFGTQLEFVVSNGFESSVYTALADGTATDSALAITANASGMLYANSSPSPDNNGELGAPVGTLPRTVLITASSVGISGDMTGTEIARIRLALAPNTGAGPTGVRTFKVGLTTDPNFDGFFDPDDNQLYTFTTSPTELVVVPEGNALAILMPGALGLSGWEIGRRLRRRKRKLRPDAPALAAS